MSHMKMDVNYKSDETGLKFHPIEFGKAQEPPDRVSICCGQAH